MGEAYFEKIPLWNDSPRFSITADKLSGRIPVTRIENWSELAELLESDFFNKPKVQYAFRGHRRYDWSLLPSLGRVTKNGIVTRRLADEQLNIFRRAVRGRLTDNALLDVSDDMDDELWSVGQHHGLMTPLLDWTYSPYVALFFAFAKEDQMGEEENLYRAIYVINKTFVSDDDDCPDIRVLEPRRDDHGRLVNQAGLFTFSPTDSTIENKLIEVLSENEIIGKQLIEAVEEREDFVPEGQENEAEVLANYICKIYIKNEDREGCLKSLRKMNVHHASLFPDLLGASDYCNLLIEEEQREYEIQQAREAIQPAKPSTVLTIDKIHEMGGFVDQTDKISSQIEEILRSYNAGTGVQVEQGRLQLIAEILRDKFKENYTVDAEKRESVQAKMRNVARVTLRKYGYPASVRDEVVERLVETITAVRRGDV